MNRAIKFGIVSLFILSMIVSPLFAKGNKQMSVEDEFAYAIAYMNARAIDTDFSQMFGEEAGETAVKAMIKGLNDYLKGIELSQERISQIEGNFQASAQKAQERLMAESNAKAEESLKKAEQFLETNKSKEGVITTESGLQYEILTQGNGAKPTEEDTVKVSYKMSANTRDNVVDQGTDVEFPIMGLIQGAIEGIPLMNVGSTYLFYIHPDMGYGNTPAGQIEPNSVLIFEVELKDIVKPQ